jgi:hypothetical protein
LKHYLEILESFVAIALAVAGLVGTSYHMFQDGGWLDTAFGRLLKYQFDKPMVAIPVTVLVVVTAILLYRRRVATGKLTKVPTLILYALMAGGAYFIGRYAIVGTL